MKTIKIVKILLIEENPNLTRMVVKMLESKGHNVIHSELCKNGLQLLLNNSFDVVMVNLSIEDCVGLPVISQLTDTEIIQKTHVITFSKDMPKEQEKELKSMGVDYCFTMPVTPEALMQAIDSFS